MNTSAPIDPAVLANDLIASRTRATYITRDLHDDLLLGPKLAIVNPPLWEIGHVAWFQEHWCLRYRAPGVLANSILPGADALYDSSNVAHDTRWNLPLPDIDTTRAYAAAVLDRVLERLKREPDDAGLHYFIRLATFHEDMHAEALHYTRQTLGYADPYAADEVAASVPRTDTAADIEFEGGNFLLGAARNDGFVFDNEKWANEVRVSPFRIARCAVTNAQYLAFVDAGGYARREFWSDDGWAWLSVAKLAAPRYWTQRNGAWHERRFDRVMPLRATHPVAHVNWHEANAYCRYAKRRLPGESEWEYAACDAAKEKKHRYPWGDAPPAPDHANLEGRDTAAVEAFADGDSARGCRQLMGNVWEWTASTFAPYPGFVADPYRDYSQPWFNTHKVLRGGSFATARRLMRNTWRNFYTPDRGDIFAGFRTCALDD
jgi:gamma-glutamyl hercynylcysteine S-oxide synthase